MPQVLQDKQSRQHTPSSQHQLLSHPAKLLLGPKIAQQRHLQLQVQLQHTAGQQSLRPQQLLLLLLLAWLLLLLQAVLPGALFPA